MRRSMLLAGISFVVTIGVLAGAWAWLGNRGANGGPGSDPGATTSPVAGDILPFETLPASAIPWGEVGPGWFLLSYDPDVAPVVWPDTGQAGFPPLDSALVLVGPNGDPYFVRSLDGFGPGKVEGWVDRSLFVLDGYGDTDSDEVFHGPLSSVDLATGATVVLNEDVEDDFTILDVLSDGRMMTENLAYDGFAWVDFLDPNFVSLGSTCSAERVAFTGPSPDGTRYVCLEQGGGSVVELVNILDGTSANIDHFKYAPWIYTMHGWWDANSFALSRVDDGGATLWWAYDVSTKKIRDLNATLSSGTPAESAEGIAGYRVVSAGGTVQVHGFDGALLADLPCWPQAISGAIALTVCGGSGAPMSISVTDLESGATTAVASFTPEANAEVAVFPWL